MKGKSKSREVIFEGLKSYYEGFDEENRLLQGIGQLEFARTQEIIQRYLTFPPAVIFDVGGAAGIYALWLAGMGYEVHLIDPVPSHVARAKHASDRQSSFSIKSCRVGDARHLDFPDQSADFILFLGPMYHLTVKEERMLALCEAFRVLKENGLVFVAAISRFASVIDGLVSKFLDDPHFVKIVKKDLLDGQHENPTGHPHYFTASHFHHPGELKREIEEADFLCEKVLPVESLGGLLQDFETCWGDPSQRTRLLEAIRWVEDEASLLGATQHLLAIARKQKRR